MSDVPVNLPEISYTIRIEPGLLNRAGAELRHLSKATKAVVVTDDIVGPLHLPALVQSLKSTGIDPIIATLPHGEQHKTL